MSARLIKRQIPIFLVFLFGIIITSDWFIKWQPLQYTAQTLMNFQVILFSAMIYFGMVNLNIVHSRNIRKNLKSKKYYDVFTSVLLIGFLAIATIIGVFFGPKDPKYMFIYNNIYTPLTLTMGILITLNISSAIYRVLRPRSIETTLLFVVALITIIINIPSTSVYFPFLISIKKWIMDILVKSTYRSITIGLGLGGILLGLRVLIGKETSYIGEEK